MLRRISQNDEVTIVFQVYLSAGCCDMRNLRHRAKMICGYQVSALIDK
jgi:hypothetical protein